MPEVDPMKSLEQGRTAPVQPGAPVSISKKTFYIGGIVTTVFGLDELPSTSSSSEVACLWLLHPRLATQERMHGFAELAINEWNQKCVDDGGQPAKGLIAVSFDQRNHGTRLVDPVGNEAWRSGNPRHAQDMFAIFQGTARDVSLLIDFLPSYIFPKSERHITQHIALGVSLGGHSTWSCLLHEPRITAGIVVIGCPDYVNLMADRARLSKLPTWTSSKPPGCEFLGSEHFPTALVETVKKLDPASLFLDYLDSTSPLRHDPIPEPTEQEKQSLRPLLSRCLAGKRILNLSGGADKLVPYHRGEVFLTWLKTAVGPDGWFADGSVVLEDIIDQTAGHEFTPKMAKEAVRFIIETLSLSVDGDGGRRKLGMVRESKI